MTGKIRWVPSIIAFLFLVNIPTGFCLTDGQNAFCVIGQPDFVTNGFNTTRTTLSSPKDVAVDVAHGKLYVADSDNNRVLRYAYPVTGNQPAAELVFGQPDFVSAGTGTTISTLRSPRSVCVDGSGRLWVGDKDNNRVVWFNQAHLIAVNQPDADGVLGQADFNSSGAATTQNGMNWPYGITVDDKGSLWVADRINNRVLRFDNAANLPNGANASGVLGQLDFNSNGNGTTRNSFNSPRGVTIRQDTLFVADRSNSRVLRFDNAGGKANGDFADRVLGQPDFVSNAPTTTQNGLGNSGRVFLDAYERLFVSDSHNIDRVMAYNFVFDKANGANADNVIGQPDFVTAGTGLGPDRLDMDSTGGGMFFDGINNYLLVADDHNHRVMIFFDENPPVPPMIPTLSQWGMMVMSVLLIFAAVAAMRRRKHDPLV